MNNKKPKSHRKETHLHEEKIQGSNWEDKQNARRAKKEKVGETEGKQNISKSIKQSRQQQQQ